MSENQESETPPKFTDDARERLRQHFLEDRTPDRWNQLWEAGDFLPWDRGTPNPALIDTLDTQKAFLPSPLNDSGGRKRALVPGCGKGYDVYLLAAYGYDAYGLEVSKALEAAKAFAPEAGKRKEYEAKDGKVGKGQVDFVLGDFFKAGWEKEIVGEGGFDIIYDYTFLCAMPPNKWSSWAARMASLLSPTGTLICLEFPTYKEPSTGGPPFALRPLTYEMLLPWPGEEPTFDAEGYVVKEDRTPNPKGLTRIAHWQPERTHAIGQGTDWVGLWKHKA